MATLDTDSKLLLSALDSLQGRAGFFSSGSAPFFFPGLDVDGVGEIAFPFSKEQAAAFIELAEAAPFGKGTKTEYDEGVRKCWQIDSKDFRFKSPQWDAFLAATLEQVREELGITGRISAQPYKLLLYGPGGHFKAHRDTEKLEAMFGTLIVALPSRHKGGKLHVRHGGEEKTVDFSAAAKGHDFQHAAFFADCEHEVVPVDSGYRFCAVFNLVLEEGDAGLLNQNPGDHARPLAALLGKVTGSQAPGTPTVILLEHQYTEANFSIRNLKGHDRQKAAALFSAADHAGMKARLALATFYQMGELEDGYDYDYGDDPEDGEMGEVYDESFELDHWRDAKDRKVSLGAFWVNQEEVITSEDFAAIEPDEKAGEGPTGNAGCTMEYWYRRAAVVLWPEGRDEEILCGQNLPEACTKLVSLSSGKKTGDGTPFDKLAKAAISMLTADGNEVKWRFHGIDKESAMPVAKILNALAQAGRGDLLEELLSKLPAERFVVCPRSLWKNLFSAFGAEAFANVFKEMLEGTENFRIALFEILAGLNSYRNSAEWTERVAAKLSRLKPGKLSRWQTASKDPIPPGNPDENGILIAAANSLSKKADIVSAIRFLKSDSSLAAVRTLIGPLFIEKGAATKIRLAENPVARELLTFCKSVLSEETARPLAPYPDWRRPCPPVPQNQMPFYHRRSNDPPVLRELVDFMADPAASEHPIRRRQEERTEAEAFIQRHFLDLDLQTIRKGTPHTLLCTKNDRSHQHALEWRKKDEEMLRKLERVSLGIKSQ